jgi:glycosyltransferase involved in cell wall biosynthesis
MRQKAKVAVIIPALNEEAAIGGVVAAIPAWVDDIVVVDNGSTDATAAIARDRGARVIREPQRGYGAACLAGLAALTDPDIIVFMDGDGSDVPSEMALLVDPIIKNQADLVIGSRVLGAREPGALTPQARFGNWLACRLMYLFWGKKYTDLGPFRAIRRRALAGLDMRDRNYGWTVEMQVKAVRRGLRVRETPVSYRRRIGASKISGTLRGAMGAGTKILYIIFREAFFS